MHDGGWAAAAVAADVDDGDAVGSPELDETDVPGEELTCSR